MTAFTDNMIAVAVRLLTAFGEAVTFTRTTEGAFDPSTSLTGAPTVVNYTARLYPSEYSAFEKEAEVIEQGDIKLLVGDTDTLPLKGDTVVVSSRTYRIQSVKRISASGIDIIYNLQARV